MSQKIERAIILAETLSKQAGLLNESLRHAARHESKAEIVKSADPLLNVERIWNLGPKRAQVNRDIKNLDSRIAKLEKQFRGFEGRLYVRIDRIESQLRGLSVEIKTQRKANSDRGRGSDRRAKRKPSEYNLFLKGKMTQGMSMIDAVKAWKERDRYGSSNSSSMVEEHEDMHSPRTEY